MQKSPLFWVFLVAGLLFGVFELVASYLKLNLNSYFFYAAWFLVYWTGRVVSFVLINDVLLGNKVSKKSLVLFMGMIVSLGLSFGMYYALNFNTYLLSILEPFIYLFAFGSQYLIFSKWLK